MKRIIASQLNVNTLIGALSLAVLVYIGHTIMEDHDSTTAHTVQLDGLSDDMRSIKADLPNYALKADVDYEDKAIWNAIRQGNTAQSPKGMTQGN